MQYKIPVQIENEDPIIWNLSLRQIIILTVWWWIAYSIFKSLAPDLWVQIAWIPSWIVAIITALIALFRQYEMTFVPFFLAFLRLNINIKERIWSMWVDSFQPMDIGYILAQTNTEKDKIELITKEEKMKSLEERLKDI